MSSAAGWNRPETGRGGASGRTVSRRALIGGGAAAVGASILGTGCSNGHQDRGSALQGDGPLAAARFIDHHGPHQPGVTNPAPRHGLVAAFDTTARNLTALRETLAALSIATDDLAAGIALPEGNPLLPPLDNRILGVDSEPDNLTISVAFGASLFDTRFGLADRIPRQLTAMPAFPNDEPNPDRSDGDILIQLCAGSETTIVHALRRLMLVTRKSLALRWIQSGFQEPNTLGAGLSSTRNLLGFKDGTANLDPGDRALMDELVWTRPGDEPEWAVGGTYQVVRIIRNRVEFWDRTPLATQQLIMGRTKDTGAPLAGRQETDIPSFDDADGSVTPLTAHIRLANPRTAESEASRILRRGFNYSNGFSASGQLDQGLLFICFQRSLDQGFLAVQERLNGEALEEYIRPVGGGFFYLPPGRSKPGESLAAGLFS